MKRVCLLIVIVCLLLCGSAAGQEGASLALSAPESIRPYKAGELVFTVPGDGALTCTVEDGVFSYALVAQQPVRVGEPFTLAWDGLGVNGEPLDAGKYTLKVFWTDGENRETLEQPLTVRTPADAIQYAIPSGDLLYAGQDGYLINYLRTASGITYIRLCSAEDTQQALRTWTLETRDALPHIFRWNGQINGKNVPDGDYVFLVSAKGSTQDPLQIELTVTSQEAPSLPLALTEESLFLPAEGAENEQIWQALMSPVAVVDIGDTSHQKVLSKPASNAASLGTIHGQGHAVIVLQLNVNGYALVGTWVNENGGYVEGYIPQKKLKMVTPNQHYGLVVDKKSQTMTVWMDGEPLGTISVSTGLMAKDKLFRETCAGAFLTTDRAVGFNSEGFGYSYVLRIDGGNLIHSAGYKKYGGSKRNFTLQTAELGQKASHGCIRTDVRAGEDGLNIYWLWTHIPFHTKVLVLDDPVQREALYRELTATPTPAPTATPTPKVTPTATGTPSPVSPAPAGCPSASGMPAQATATPSPTQAVYTATPAPATPVPVYSGLIGYRSRGEAVVQLQERLTALGYYAGAIDGAFGNATYQAVKEFQKANGLDADGIVGQQTFEALYALAAVPESTPSPTPKKKKATQSPEAAPAATSTPTPVQTPSPSPVPTATPAPPPETDLVLTFGGDAVLASEEKIRKDDASFDSYVQRLGYAYPLSNLASLFAQDDVTTLNLECVLKDNAQDKTAGRLYNFRGPTAFTQILKEASVEHVNIANNHYIDYGDSGRKSTRNALSAAGIGFSGYTWLHTYTKDGVTIGFAGIRETVFHQNRAQMAEDIKKLRAMGCDYVVYSCHFGTEYDLYHNEMQTTIAHMAIDAGADCVIGTHPHVVQGVEVYEGKPIFYSLGNLVFGGNLAPTDYDGLVVQFALHFDHGVCTQTTLQLIPVMTSGIQDGTTNFQPVIAQGEDKARILERIRQDSEDLAVEETMILSGNPN